MEELTWEKVQDIWFITDRLLHSIPEDFSKWDEWMFNTQGRCTKALEEINKYWETKRGVPKEPEKVNLKGILDKHFGPLIAERDRILKEQKKH